MIMACWKLEKGLISLDCPVTVVNGVKHQSKGSLCGIDQFRDMLGCSGFSQLRLGGWLGDWMGDDCTSVLGLDDRVGPSWRRGRLHRGRDLLVLSQPLCLSGVCLWDDE